jgi:shikimate O-hydroxycinnamoyltransferase
MQVRIISRETIKPSSPTPSHLKTLKFSLFDQIAPKSYIPAILFYSTNDGLLKHAQISSQLKKSLSEALTRFYPLSGREKDQFSIQCNDEGASYSEALVDYNMSDFLDPPKMDLLNQLLPCQPWVTCQDRASAVCLAIQVNVFNCGGIAIGVCVLHTIADGITVSAFLKSWATIARGANDQQLFRPDFTTASTLFPPRDLLSLTCSNRLLVAWKKEAISVTRRFVFDANAIVTLKAKAEGEYVSNPTRYESLAALIWKCLIGASMKISGLARPSLLEHAVDIRRRMGQPLSADSMGNVIIVANAVYDPAETNIILRDLATIVRQSIEEVNGDFMRTLQGDEGFLLISGYAEMIAEMLQKEEPESFGFTNWCNFGLNEVDFGWGKPLWVGASGGDNLSFVNCVLFKDMECGKGTEAWVTLEEKEMAAFENDPDLLAYAFPNPSVSRP